jgi:hypothetical protein
MKPQRAEIFHLPGSMSGAILSLNQIKVEGRGREYETLFDLQIVFQFPD